MNTVDFYSFTMGLYQHRCEKINLAVNRTQYLTNQIISGAQVPQAMRTAAECRYFASKERLASQDPHLKLVHTYW